MIERRLYLPQSWSGATKKRKKAKVPSKVRFASKGQLARAMLQRVFQAGIRPAWFVADEVYSRDAELWRWLEQTAKQPYVLTVSKQQPTLINFHTHYAAEPLQQVKAEDWHCLSSGAGTKGERDYEWARVELSCRQPEGFNRWLLFRRCPRHRDDSRCISYYQAFAPSHTPLKTLVGVVGQRWRIEECFQFAKDQLGLGDYEVRSWTGWHRHTSLVLAAQAFLGVLRYQVEPLPKLSAPLFFPTPNRAGSLDAFKAARGLWFD